MKHGPIDLKRTQNLFWELISAPEGVRAALDGSSRSSLPAVDEVFAGDERLAAVDRVDIYANMYFYRLLDALREDYPRVETAIGGRAFHNLVTDYLLRHPSGHPSLRYLGSFLPEFLRSHAMLNEYRYLADLAALEWARVDIFDAPDTTPATRDDLARLPQEKAGEARLRLIPAFRLERYDHDVVRLWRELRDPEAIEEQNRGTEGNAALEGQDHFTPARGPRELKKTRIAARIWRSEFIVYHKGIAEEEAHCLELTREGASLERICQVLAAGRSPERATERVGKILQSWLDDGLVAEISISGS